MLSHHQRLWLKKWARSLHIYLSLFGLMAVVFFAITGFLLNHPVWFGLDKIVTSNREGVVLPALLAGPDKLAVVEELRAKFGARGALDTFEIEEREIRVNFRGPAQKTEVIITRADGRTQVLHETRSVMARITELHRGTDSGPAWSVLIDVTALLVMLSTGTGVVLWLIVPKWRAWGVAALVTSGIFCVVIYWFLVP